MTVEERRRIGALRARVTRHERAMKVLGADAFVGTGQVAEIMGIAKTNVNRDLRRAGLLPEPDVETAAGPLWLRSRVELAKAERDLRRAEED